MDTNPALGSTVPYGSTVALKMSSGEVEVPSVVGMTVQEAENELGAVGLSGRRPDPVPVPADMQPGDIVSQNPGRYLCCAR